MKQFKCPRRSELPAIFKQAERESDYDASRDCCSWCGSLDPDTFMERVERGDVLLGSTDKSYKVYVKNDGGAELKTIKFYFQHLSREQRARFVELMNEPDKLRFEGGYRFYVLPFFATIVTGKETIQ